MNLNEKLSEETQRAILQAVLVVFFKYRYFNENIITVRNKRFEQRRYYNF
jgi:hypothetical protein